MRTSILKVLKISREGLEKISASRRKEEDMFQNMRCKRFKKEQNRREVEVIRIAGKLKKNQWKLRMLAMEQDRMGFLSLENRRLCHKIDADWNRLLQKMTDIATDMKTAGILHRMNCSSH